MTDMISTVSLMKTLSLYFLWNLVFYFYFYFIILFVLVSPEIISNILWE